MIAELIRKNRTCRRFYQDYKLDLDVLKGLVDLARLSASAGNLQPLKYHISNTPEMNEKIYPCLGWAAYLKDWSGPVPGERPSGYITILGDTSITKNYWCDHGIASQSMLLGAREQGLAGCIFGSVRKKEMTRVLNLPEHLEILLVIAIGKPREIVSIEQLGKDGDIRYWRDENGVHHVPKRDLEDIII